MISSTAIRGAEILEEDAEGKIKTLYDDIKLAFRVPVVDSLFRLLAAQHVDYLQVAWRALKPNVRTVFFERQSDDLRILAIDRVTAFDPPAPLAIDEGVRNVLRAYHYVNPKLLLAMAALRSATMGQEPRLQELTGEEKRQLPSGLAEGAAPMAHPDPGVADERSRDVLHEMGATLGLNVQNDEYRALGRWPEYFESAWAELKPVTLSPDYKRILQDLGRATQPTVASMPFRVELNPHTLRHCGLSEQDIDSVRALLNDSYAFLLRRVVNMAFLASASLGHDAAARSPYPVSAAEGSASKQ